MLWSIFFGIITILLLAYGYIRKQYAYWERRGVLSPTPKFPLGNYQGMGSKHLAEITKSLYDTWKGKSSFIGIYMVTVPTVLITDPELVKNVLVRDFDYFHNRGFYYNESDDPLSAHLFALDDIAWKDIRAKLTPTFTSGKMKMMFVTVASMADRMIEHVLPIASRGEIIDIKDIISRYTTDVIGTCAFGIECNSFKDPEAEFCVKGREIFNPGLLQQFRIFFGIAFPSLARKLGMRAIEKRISDFFIDAVSTTINYRKSNGVKRNDFMHLMLELQKKHEYSLETFSDLNIAAQAFLFFAAGFETSSSTMAFALYEMAQNSDIQETLRQEINDVIGKHNDDMTYEVINKMPYLDQVIDETLRKYPSLESLLRKTTRDYLVPGTSHVIEKGILVNIPVFGLHRDPDIYPNPDQFDPERFTDENKATRHPFTYLPFGEGPHNCIGARFGVMQARLGLISIVRNFNILLNVDTIPTITFNKSSPTIISDKPIMLRLKPLELM